MHTTLATLFKIKKQKNMREHLANFHIAGLTYYDYVLCAAALEVGTVLTLKRDTENKFDARAVAIYFNEFKLGFVPRAENRLFYKLLTTGHDIFETRILNIDKTEHPENMIRVIIHIIAKQNNNEE